MVVTCLCAVLTALVSAAAQTEQVAVAPFKPGERVVFLGDSITHGGRYVCYLQLFASLRHPGCGISCLNSGVSGDSAGGAVKRLEWDALAMKPDRLFVMFGMNDVGRTNYKTVTPTEKEEKARTESLKGYERNERKLAEMISAAGVTTCFMTPSPYDQYSDVKTENLVACNEPGLAACAGIVRTIAAEKRFGLVDLHAPLTETFRTHANRHFCSDRVHPAQEGHLLMASYVLEAMGYGPTVARVSIDAAAGAVRPETANADVTALRVTGKGVAFTYAPKSLPFPALPEYLKDDEIRPLTKMFNQETFVVAGLSAGTYELAFDGEAVGTFTAGELAAGVNVALLDTPNQKRAKAAATLANSLQANESVRRNLTLTEVSLVNGGVDPKDRKAADAFLDKRLADMAASKSISLKYYTNVYTGYRKNREIRDDLADRTAELYARLDAVRPEISRVTIRSK